MRLSEVIGLGLKFITVIVFSKYSSMISRIGVGLKDSHSICFDLLSEWFCTFLIICLIFVEENALYSKKNMI